MNGEHKKPVESLSEDRDTAERYHCIGGSMYIYREKSDGRDLFVLASDYERLRETFLCPRLTPDAPAEQFTAVLRDHDKGHPVNAQDLINALMWRVKNQRHEISKLHERLRRKASDEAPSFSPNFDERNGIR